MRRDIYSWLTIPARRWVPVTLALQLSSVVLIYVLVRLRSF
jgi:hypothetical protein